MTRFLKPLCSNLAFCLKNVAEIFKISKLVKLLTSQQIKNFLYLKRNFKKPLKRSRNGEKFVKFGHAVNSDPDVDQSD